MSLLGLLTAQYERLSGTLQELPGQSWRQIYVAQLLALLRADAAADERVRAGFQAQQQLLAITPPPHPRATAHPSSRGGTDWRSWRLNPAALATPATYVPGRCHPHPEPPPGYIERNPQSDHGHAHRQSQMNVCPGRASRSRPEASERRPRKR